MKIKHLFIGLLAMAAAASCAPEEAVTPSLEIDKTEVELAAEGAKVTVTVKSNVEWTATPDAEWLTITPSGSGASEKPVEVEITAEDNDSEQARTANVKVACEGIEVSLKVTQLGKVIVPDPDQPDPDQPAATYTVTGDIAGEGNVWNNAAEVGLMTLEGDYYVAKNLVMDFDSKLNPDGTDDYVKFKICVTGTWDGAYGQSGSSVNSPNTAITVAVGGGDILINAAGTYDIYFDLANTKVWVMTAGSTPGEALPEPEKPEVTSYTVAGTILGTETDKKANYWKEGGEAGLMTLEGDYYVAKNINLEYDYRFSDDGTGKDFAEFKICATGTWDEAFGQEAEGLNQPNTEIAVVAGGQSNICIETAGVYDIYFDAANAKVWVMEAGYMPGEEIAELDGYQWEAVVDEENKYLFDFGLTEPGMLIIAVYDTDAYFRHIVAEYEIEDGLVFFTDVETEEEYIAEYSDLTSTTATIVFEAFDLEDVTITKVVDPYPIEYPVEKPLGPAVVTVAEFLDAAEDDTMYQLTGVITSVTNTTYGNFYLKDETGEVLIYGLCSPEGESKYWAASGAKVGDTITVQTKRTSHNGTPQGKNAAFVSLVPFVAEASEYGLVGDFTGWGTSASDVVLYSTWHAENLFVAYNVEIPSGGVKVRANGNWDGANIGFVNSGAVEADKYYTIVNDANSQNISLMEYGTYDVYLDMANMRMAFMTPGTEYVEAADGVKPIIVVEGLKEHTWGLVGNINGEDKWSSDIAMEVVGDWAVAKNVTFKQWDNFKFRADGSWDLSYGGNCGVAVGTTYTTYNNGGNMWLESEDGAYNVYFSLVTAECYIEKYISATTVSKAMKDLGYENAAPVTEVSIDDNITLTFDQGTSSTAPAYYDSGEAIRLYQNGATLTVDANGRTISSMKITFAYDHYYMAPDCGEFSEEADVRTWTGSAKTVKFTSTGSDKDHRAYISAIEVTYE